MSAATAWMEVAAHSETHARMLTAALRQVTDSDGIRIERRLDEVGAIGALRIRAFGRGARLSDRQVRQVWMIAETIKTAFEVFNIQHPDRAVPGIAALLPPEEREITRSGAGAVSDGDQHDHQHRIALNQITRAAAARRAAAAT